VNLVEQIEDMVGWWHIS